MLARFLKRRIVMCPAGKAGPQGTAKLLEQVSKLT